MAISPTLTGNGAPQIATFDHNVLGAFYSSGVSLGMNGHAAKILDELLNGSFANVDPASHGYTEMRKVLVVTPTVFLFRDIPRPAI